MNNEMISIQHENKLSIFLPPAHKKTLTLDGSMKSRAKQAPEFSNTRKNASLGKRINLYGKSMVVSMNSRGAESD